MSSYLIAELDRYGVEVRDRSEIAELHGEHGRLDGVTLKDGTRLPVKFAFMFLGAAALHGLARRHRRARRERLRR